MIRVVMLGRLGNNLFQYALGRVLSEKHGVPLLMDASWFNEDGWGQVNCIRQLPGPSAGKARIVRRASMAARALRRFNGRHYWDYRGVPILRESEMNQSFDPAILNAPPDCMLFGYFQTPRYFQGHEQLIRTELSTVGLGLESAFPRLAEELRRPGSVAVHVRRTDYVGNHNLDVCDTSYYLKAAQRMRAHDADATFHIFSDDPAGCAVLAERIGANVIPHRDNSSPLADLHLMSLANHHIIANSSFSWWAAWLGAKPEQQVLMPGTWFNTIRAPIEEKRLPGWECVR